MQYRKNNWSLLGYGCMRLPKKGNAVDMEESEKLLKYAIEHGINYYDTAYIYAGNEKAFGELLAKGGWREQVEIATKMPHYLIRSMDGLEKVFKEQLSRLQTDYVDNYLMHMLTDVGIWNKLIRMGILEWIKEKKASGQIRRVGFSYHGNTENFIKLVDAYDWDFVQVQYNYMDEHTQAGRRGVEYAASKGLPVIIMEPLRGGKLVKDLPKEAVKAFAGAKVKRSPAEWGFRWLMEQESVAVVLSGMNSMEMLKENIRIAEDASVKELTPEEIRLFERVKKSINGKMKVGCTACGYCQPCPFGVDIPGCFRCYNASYIDNFFTGMREYLMCTSLRGIRTNAGLCKSCGKCEQHCPQGISIRKELKNVRRRLENPAFKVITFFGKWLFRQ